MELDQLREYKYAISFGAIMGLKDRLWLKVAIVLSILFLLDQGSRNLELNSMVTKIQKSESVMLNYNKKTSIEYKKFYDGANTEFHVYATENQISRIAQESAPAIAAEGAKIERIYVAPWHRAIIRAQQDYLNHNDAWVKSLSADIVIDEKFGDEMLRQEISNTWEISKFSLPDAVPMLDLYSLESKIRIIFEN